MRVKMLKDAPGSPDGIHINEYADGEIYDVTDDLGVAFVAEGFAQEDRTKKPALDGGVNGDATAAGEDASASESE